MGLVYVTKASASVIQDMMEMIVETNSNAMRIATGGVNVNMGVVIVILDMVERAVRKGCFALKIAQIVVVATMGGVLATQVMRARTVQRWYSVQETVAIIMAFVSMVCAFVNLVGQDWTVPIQCLAQMIVVVMAFVSCPSAFAILALLAMTVQSYSRVPTIARTVTVYHGECA